MASEPFLSTLAQKAYLGIIVIQALVVLSLIAASFALIQEEISLRVQVSKTVPCYFAIFALAELYELILAVDALYFHNIMQMGGVLAFHAGALVYSALQVGQTKRAIVTLDPNGTCYAHCGGPGTLWARVKIMLIVVPVIIGVAFLLLSWTFYKLYHEFGWSIFHHLGADPRKKRMYRWYQILILLIKLDWFFFTGLTLQLLILVLSEDTAEFGVTIAAIPIVLFLLGACVLALKREIKWLMVLCLILFCLSQGYFIFKFVRYYEPATRHLYDTTRATISVFTAVAFLIDFASFFVGIICFADFDKGLRASKSSEAPGSKFVGSYAGPVNPEGDKRLIID